MKLKKFPYHPVAYLQERRRSLLAILIRTYNSKASMAVRRYVIQDADIYGIAGGGGGGLVYPSPARRSLVWLLMAI